MQKTSRTLLFFTFILLPMFILFAHGVSEADKQNMIAGGYLQYIWLGASHMLTGYDHLLFLFGVIFFLTKFKDVAKFITAFTLGHCITLIFATFWEITANYYIIDAIIALTVLYKGFDNLDGFKKFFKINSPNLLMLVFIFGLIHGFGLSTRLQQLPLGDKGLLLKILSFNLGVEVGQIIALTAMLFLLNIWRRYESFRKFSTLSNVGLVCAGIVLFIFQMNGFVNDPINADTMAAKKEQMQQSRTANRNDSITIIIPAQKSLEYKFLIEKSAYFEYTWETNGPELYFDFHGEPTKGDMNSFKSFKKATDTKSKGTFTPAFTGTFGWYWENKSSQDVKVYLKTKGDYQLIANQNTGFWEY